MNRLRIWVLLLMCVSAMKCESNSAAKQERKLILGSLLLPSGRNSAPNCNGSPAFYSLNTAGITVSCGSCHGSGIATAGVDISSYSSLSAVVQPGSPENSLLYQVLLPGGKMNQYTNPNLTDAVYCWIKGGALP